MIVVKQETKNMLTETTYVPRMHAIRPLTEKFDNCSLQNKIQMT